MTDAIRVRQIAVSTGGEDAEIQDLQGIASQLAAFNGSAYDNTVDSTRLLFQQYLLFQPGTYEITYEIVNESGGSAAVIATHLQRIIIGQECGGCLGCNSRCESCRNRYIMDMEKGARNFIDVFLLLGLAALMMRSWPGMF